MPSSRSASARAFDADDAADLTTPGTGLILPVRAKVAELVDAQGSGPCSPYRLWGFESPLSHQFLYLQSDGINSAGLSRFTYDGSCQTNSEGREG